ncbi:MAG: winged helix-turn-helix domain-containing protein, partial [Oscillospiraceae bacterium]|nr:winged helix-turn-helix domain-containing protein [Oscillospiraceae bacterium]
MEKAVLEYIDKNGSINNSEGCTILDLKPTRVKDLLREMVESGMIKSVGEKKNRRYIKA